MTKRESLLPSKTSEETLHRLLSHYSIHTHPTPPHMHTHTHTVTHTHTHTRTHTHSRLFNWLAYILFFYNGIAGFISAILRTLMSSLFSLLLLFRLDQVVLLKGFEQFDFGMSAVLENPHHRHRYRLLLKKDCE